MAIATTRRTALQLGLAALGLAATGAAAPAPGEPANAVTIDNFTFNPPTLTVKAGAAVTWTNRDDIPHGIAAAGNAIARSPALDTGDSFSFTFTTPGTYKYFCYIHPHMTGTIVVEAADGAAATQ